MTYDEISKLTPRKLYRELARRTFEQELKHGTDKLTAAQRRFCLVAELHGETMNGGLIQYFANSSGKNWELALEALNEIGAKQQEELVLKWLKRLPASVKPGAPSEVGHCVFSNPGLDKDLGLIDQQYFAAAGSLYQAVAKYLKSNIKKSQWGRI